MRDRRRRPQYTPRLVETPEGVRQVAKSVHQRLGRDSYEAPFEIASVLRAYGVRVISALGDRATEALQTLSEHRDFRVRATVADELRRHQDVSAIRLLSKLAEDDENPDVQKAASVAVEELREVAEKLALEQAEQQVVEEASQTEAAPEMEIELGGDSATTLLTSGEDAAPNDETPPDDDPSPPGRGQR